MAIAIYTVNHRLKNSSSNICVAQCCLCISVFSHKNLSDFQFAKVELDNNLASA